MDFENSNDYRIAFRAPNSRYNWRNFFSDLVVVVSFAILLAVGLIQAQTKHIESTASARPLSVNASSRGR